MSKINIEIPVQNYELYRDKLAIILQDELDNQYALTGNELFNLKVFCERFVDFDNTELPALNVYFRDARNLEKNHRSTKYEYSYIIQTNVSNRTSVNERGDVLSSLKLQKLTGVIRYILEHEAYKTLGLTLSISNIFNTKINTLQIIKPTVRDSVNVSGSVIEYIIQANEDEGYTDAIVGEIYTTQIKLEETDKGYYFIINN